MSEDEFIKICDLFTNKEIFKTNSNGELIKIDGKPLLINEMK